jgi:flagellar basal body-associated protein FliL
MKHKRIILVISIILIFCCLISMIISMFSLRKISQAQADELIETLSDNI